MSFDAHTVNLSKILSLSNKLTNFGFKLYCTHMLKRGFLVLFMSHTFTFKYYLEIIYLPFCINYTEPTVAIMSVKKFFTDLVSAPKFITFLSFPKLCMEYHMFWYHISLFNICSVHRRICYQSGGACSSM